MHLIKARTAGGISVTMFSGTCQAHGRKDGSNLVVAVTSHAEKAAVSYLAGKTTSRHNHVSVALAVPSPLPPRAMTPPVQ